MRWIMVIIALAFLLSTFLMYDSGSRRGGSGSSGEMADYAVADVNGRRLMRSALEQRVRQHLEELGNTELTSADWPYIYQAALDQYVMEQQLAQEVKDSGIKISDAEAEQAMKDYADQYFPTREAFYQTLERSGIKVADYKKNVAQQLASQQLVISSIGTVAVSEDEVAEFYENMKDLFFRQPSGFKISLANFSSKEEAEKLKGRLDEGMAWSMATSGDMVVSSDVVSITTEPVFVPDSTFEDYLAPMKSLDIGVASPVFELSSEDFAVGVKDEKVEEQVSALDEVSADIRGLLLRQKESSALNNFNQELLGRAKIVIHDPSLFPSKSQEVLPVTESRPEDSGDTVPAQTESSVASPDAETEIVDIDAEVVSGE